MNIKPIAKAISTEAEYNATIKRIDALVNKGDKTTAEEDAYLELLGILAEDYERRHQPELEEAVSKPVSPLEAISWAMDRHGLRQKDLAPLIGSESLVSSVLSGRRQLSKAMISRLHEALGIPFEDLFPAQPQRRRFNLPRLAAAL